MKICFVKPSLEAFALRTCYSYGLTSVDANEIDTTGNVLPANSIDPA